MKGFSWIFALSLVFSASWLSAEHVIVAGGPSLNRWEQLRVPEDRHDRWWANFIRASTIRMDDIRRDHGEHVKITWIVHRDSYVARGLEDGKPYTDWIVMQAKKRRASLVWFKTSEDFIRAINNRSRGSVASFDFFGHSNRHAFMFDYGAEIMAASTSWLHERDLRKIDSSIFARGAVCKSWGCHTGESMSQVWKRHLGLPLVGNTGATSYRSVGHGELPAGRGRWKQ